VSTHNIQRELDNIASDGVGLQIASASTDKIAFLGATPVAQQTALTTVLTTLTNAGTASDYAIQAIVSSGAGNAYGFVTQAEGETVVDVVLNNQARINEIEDVLQAFGFLA